MRGEIVEKERSQMTSIQIFIEKEEERRRESQAKPMVGKG
jgi:hypothetical protein